LGLGADKLTTFSYYVLGDPFSYLIAFFPKGRLELGYNLLILLRLYASGLAFLFFARQRSFKPASQLVGTLAYTFTGYSLYVSIRHPFFLLPMILFPLLAYGIDHVLSGKSWIPLAIFTGLALISNFYFAYILALGSLVYAVLRYLAIRQTVSLPHWRVLWQLVGAGLTGFLLAGVLFIPSLLGVLSSTRATANFANGYWLYPLNYYLRFPNAIITTGNPLQFWVNLGLSGLTFLALVFVLRHFRRYLWLNISLILLMVGVLLPAVAAVMNGGTTPSQRWLLLGCLAFSLAVMTFVDELPQLSRGDIATLIWSVLGLLIIVWVANGFIYNNHRHDFTMYGLLLLTLGAVIVGSFYQWTPRLWQIALLSLLGL
ncbi:YfhO family protein, partial [Lacticaseibacillus paracasei]